MLLWGFYWLGMVLGQLIIAEATDDLKLWPIDNDNITAQNVIKRNKVPTIQAIFSLG
jgi:hypothetical protein